MEPFILAGNMAQRLLVAGPTKSGKSYLIKKWLLREYQGPFLVLDVDFNWSHEKLKRDKAHHLLNVYVTHDLKDVETKLEAIGQRRIGIIYQPYDETEKHLDEVCRLVHKQLNLLFIFEELERYCTRHKYPDPLEDLTHRDRHRGIGIIGTAKQVSRVNGSYGFNCDHIITFKFTRPHDLKYLRGWMGDCVLKIPKLAKYQFIWYDNVSCVVCSQI